MTIPTPDNLKKISKSLATLDAIIMQEWELRYYSHNSHWAPTEEMSSMRNGSGDHYFVWFTPNGSVGKGFCKGTAISKERAYEGIPEAFVRSFLEEPAFLSSEVSFAFWSLEQTTEWAVRPRDALQREGCPDQLLGVVMGGPESYQKWAKDYYERDIPITAVLAVFRHAPVDETLLAQLNPGADRAQLAADLAEIGYPSVL
ncbi:MAG: hypothetical protein JWQ04_1224 [Pedosphaera sp.]|nr:hypothetical protein [Pedosphaera sp.]